MSYRLPARAPSQLSSRPVVIGAGPCGLFAALTLAQMGFRPIIIERGKVVRERTKDTWGLWRRSVLDPQSNVQFGEGGAGTFSDGKLYSGIKDHQHRDRKVLTEFVEAGAPSEILFVAKPHIGTFRLVPMLENLRARIEALGGEYRFQSQVTDIDVAGDGTRRMRGIALESGERIAADHVVLAVGHSARDTFQMLFDRGVHIEAKPFSIGVRIEHPQSLIDRCRFGDNAGNKILGAADYKLVHHASNGRSVYSFCMCPGGTVVAAASEAGGVVTNGMSQYSRNERNANAGIVVAVTPADYPGHPLAGIAFQRQWEHRAFEAGGGTFAAPAQLVGDFLAGRPSTALGTRRAVLQAGRPACRSRRLPARLRRHRDPRSVARLRPPDQGLCHARRGHDRSRDADVLYHPHWSRQQPAEPEHAGTFSGRRGGRLRWRHPLGRRRRHSRRRGRCARYRRAFTAPSKRTRLRAAEEIRDIADEPRCSGSRADEQTDRNIHRHRKRAQLSQRLAPILRHAMRVRRHSQQILDRLGIGQRHGKAQFLLVL